MCEFFYHGYPIVCAFDADAIVWKKLNSNRSIENTFIALDELKLFQAIFVHRRFAVIYRIYQ